MKKLLTILVLIMLIISFFQITSMYALYKEQIQGEYNTLLGAWTVKVNNTDITTSGQVETFTIANTQLGYVNSEHIQAGKIAPNGQVYFDIVIDPLETDVSIIYKIDINPKATSSTNEEVELENAIEFVSGENYFGKGDDGQTDKTVNSTSLQNGNTYTSVIPVDKINEGYKNYIRLYFKWKNVTETLEEAEIESNNEFDTELGQIEDTKLTISLNMNLKQYTGEVIGNE